MPSCNGNFKNGVVQKITAIRPLIDKNIFKIAISPIIKAIYS
jgi:hypothetical protein